MKNILHRMIERQVNGSPLCVAAFPSAASKKYPLVKALFPPSRTLATSLALLAAITLPFEVGAAEAPSQAWPSAISGTGSTVGSARTFTWGSSPYGSPGVSATQTITSRVTAPSAAGCQLMGGSTTGAVVNAAPNVTAFIEPDFPAGSLLATNCLEGSNGYVSSFQFSKPVIAPIFHFYNLDASRFAISGTSTTGAAIGLTTIVKNNLLDISGTTLNNTVQGSTAVGCNDNVTTNSNGACGSFRVTAASGLIQNSELK